MAQHGREALWLGKTWGFLERTFVGGGRKGEGETPELEKRLLIIRGCVCVVFREGGCLMVYHVKRRAKADRR